MKVDSCPTTIGYIVSKMADNVSTKKELVFDPQKIVQLFTKSTIECVFNTATLRQFIILERPSTK